MHASDVGVVGAGGWGTALAVLIARNGRSVTLWSRRDEHARRLAKERVNQDYLPGVELPSSIRVTSELCDLAPIRRLILAVPSQSVRGVFRRLRPLISNESALLNAAKGLEVQTGLRLSQALASEGAGERVSVLSGPNHAEEVGRELPTTSVIASELLQEAEAWQELLMGATFRAYTNDDVVGVELGGALKNVIALAAGICDGLGYGDNTKAALITRGLAEMSRLGVCLGARLITFSGLSGMGDLIATCTSDKSRNRQAGLKIGQGASVDDVVKQTPMVIEGIPTCKAALALAKRNGVEMPITQAVSDVLFSGKDPRKAVAELMRRGPKGELAAILT